MTEKPSEGGAKGESTIESVERSPLPNGLAEQVKQTLVLVPNRRAVELIRLWFRKARGL